MSIRRYVFYFLPILFAAILIGLPIKSQYFKPQNQTVAQVDTILTAGRNVNMVSGTDPLTGDPYLQRQNEPSIAVSTRNPLHLLSGANDYRTVDMEIPAEELPGVQQGIAAADAWLGVFKSFDGGESWISKLLPGSIVDTSLESLSSPIHGYGAAADPVVRAGANGLFFFSGITFNRLQRGLGALFVSRFIDNNNKETGDPIQYLDTKILDLGNSGHFIDKPWLAVDVPRTTDLIMLPNGAFVPRANVFVVYTSFMGNTEGDVHGKLMITMSRDCGQTWDKPTQITDAGQPYQAANVAIDPRNGRLYIAYRRFGKYGFTNAIMMLAEKDPKNVGDIGYIHENLKFLKPVLVAEIAPFDQPTVETMFRTNTYPTMAIDNNGIVYLAWSQRNALNYARVVLKTYDSAAGLWRGPYAVCDETKEFVWGHQFMPALSYAAGKVTLVWYDQRYDISDVPSYYIDDTAPNLWRHTIDVRATQFDPGAIPTIPNSIQVSKYPWLLYMNGPDGTELWAKQLLYFKPDLYLFLHGTRAFIGDYIDLSPSPQFVPNGNGWKYNTEPIQNPIFHAVWGDNRDVKESTNWIDFVHPIIGGDPNCSQGSQAGIRNQNIYTSRLSRGIIAGSPGNTKPLNIKRAFVVLIKNTTEIERNLNLTIISSGPTAKFQERGVESDSLNITVPPYSTMSTTVSVGPYGNLYASVTVNISEGNNLLAKVILNPDSTNPWIEEPDVDYEAPHVAALNETHTPHVAAYEIIEWNYESANPHVAAPHVAAPHVAAYAVNDDWVTPHVAAPHVAAPHVAAPHVAATNIINPHVAATNFSADDMTANSSLTDVYYGVDNVGNTTSSFSIGTLPVNLPEGIFVQMLIYRVYTTPSSVGCQLVQQEHHELLSNITPHVAAVSPGGTSVNLKANNISQDIPVDATTVIPPGGRVIIMYRILDKNKYDNNKIDPTSFVPEIRQDAKDVINGQEQTVIPPPALVITTQSLDKAYIGLPYSQTLTAEGGYPPYTWSLVEKPGWMSIDQNTGVIGGTPTTPEGIFDVNVEVKDTPPAGIQQQVTPKTFKITVAYPPDLIVGSLTHAPEFPTTTDEITFTAVVKNQGQGSAGPSTLELLVGGETHGDPGTQFSVPALAPGAIHTFQRKKTLTVAQGYTNTATADLNNVLPESNENNNVTIDTFTVIIPHTVSAPTVPSGPTTGFTNVSSTYSSDGSTCSAGHSVEYQFDWRDGNISAWSSLTSASHSWASVGTYNVRAQARCSVDHAIISGWSAELPVTIGISKFKVVYIYQTDTTSANSFKNTLAAKGIVADLLQVDSINSFDFGGYSVVLIGNDTGSSSRTWGGVDISQDDPRVTKIVGTGLPVIAIGVGNLFFDAKNLNINIGWLPSAEDNSQTSILKVNPSHTIWNSPNVIGGTTVDVYQTPGYRDELFQGNVVPGVVTLAQCPVVHPAGNYFPIVSQDRFLKWGFYLSPDSWTQTGKDLFENVVTWCVGLYGVGQTIDTWDKPGDLAGWRQNTSWTILEVVDTGGNPGGYLSSKSGQPSPYYAGACTEKAQFKQHFDTTTTISVDLKVLSDLNNISHIYIRFRYKDGSHNGWVYALNKPSSMDVWNTYSVTFNPNWTDAEATTAGWVNEDLNPSFTDTMHDIYYVEVRFEGSNMSVGIDNFTLRR
jgi:hypothetical protein